MKTVFWVVDNGMERKSTYKDFRYWYDNFCKSVMDRKGNVYDKNQISIKDVDLIYNGFGYAIGGRNR